MSRSKRNHLATPFRILAAAIPLACACLGGMAARVQAQTPELMVIKETGPRDKRVNIVILGDGYIASEKSKFLTHMKTVADAVVKDLPLTDYADYFNIYGIFVASNQSGADDPSQGITRDTYFGASYSGRLLTITNSKAFAVINKYLPEADMQFIVVNSDTYGGSGGQVAVANYTSPEIIAHESQHSFSGLGDEYDYAGVTPWESPNTTKQTNRASIRWTHWIAESTPVPTPETQPYAKLPGLFEGAAYNPVGWYRPKQNCRMRENGIPFCEVCSETIILSMYGKVSPLDSVFPKPGVVAVAAGEIPPLRIVPKKPLAHAMQIAWLVDGKVLPGESDVKLVAALAPGAHKVVVRVTDTTHLVRKDPSGLLNDTAAWTVNVANTSALARTLPSSAPGLINADARQGWFSIPDGQTFGIRLMTADGRLLERRRIAAEADGRARITWSKPLSPGLYMAETVCNGMTFHSRFSISP